jgi:adenylate cyclase
MKNVSFRPRIAIPAGIVIVVAIAGLLGGMERLENSVFDLFLRFKKDPVELSKSITLVDFNDAAVQKAGTWPIGRDVMANGLMLLRECGSRYAVFDIEYVDKSPRGVNSDFLTESIPETFNNEFGVISVQMENFFGALQTGNISLREAKPYIEDFKGLIQKSKETLQEEVAKVAQDNDKYLGEAIRFHGSAFLTIHLLKDKGEKVPPETIKLALDKFALGNVTAKGALIPDTPGIQPPILPIESEAKGLGFTNVVIDTDGVRRRINLVARYGDAYFPQLVFSPLLDILGNPALIIEKKAITMKDARFPDGSVKTVRIPMDSNGRFIVNWPHKKFLDSFTHMSFAELIQHKEYYDNLVYNLKLRDSWGYLDLYRGETPLLELYRQSESLRKFIMEGEEKPEAVADYRALRDRFLGEVGAYLDGKPEDQIEAMVQAVLDDRKTPEADKEQYRRIGEDAPEYFAALRQNYTLLIDIRKDIIAKTDGTICILGQTNTGSTDIGINPFDNEYPNVGTHASVINTILTRDFIWDAPSWVSALIAVALTALLVFALSNTKPIFTIFSGLGACVAVFAIDAIIFMLTGIYTPILPPLISIFLSFLALTFIQFIETEREKGFIRSAFGHYLSEAVIKDIVGNPDKLKLGGELRNMTAIFTDIRGFSTISEKLSAEELVRLLNEYLTGMSDCILDMGGTIDKYEGDAIICFFGAPLDLPDHALKACQAAIRMKRIEAALNVKFLETGMAPSNLMTRIGINTGNMVVGNMGTTKKMDYTIMGDAVNLAARLEGVNKQYGTWLCISEDTMTAAGKGIEVRRLDRIRVVGKSQPIRIYELVEESGKLTKEQAEMIKRFEEALELFEARKWNEAESAFNRVLEIVPDDGPSKTYIDRIAKYKVAPPPDDWDGVFNLMVK